MSPCWIAFGTGLIVGVALTFFVLGIFSALSEERRRKAPNSTEQRESDHEPR